MRDSCPNAIYRKSPLRTEVSIPKLVHLFGPDGSGKSTQADILTNFLKGRGIRVKKCWVRGTHTLAFVLCRFLVKIGFYRTVRNQFGIAKKFPAVHSNRPLKLFWSTVELLGVIPHILRVHFLFLRGYRVVAERYVLDTAVSVAYTIDDADFLRSPLSRLFLCFIPKETTFIFLDSDYKTILDRRLDGLVQKGRLIAVKTSITPSISTRYVEPEDMIQFQRTAYNKLAKSYDALVVDTSKHTVEETSSLVSKYLGIQ